MNRTFREVASEYKRVVTLTHVQRVTRMYRQSLRLAQSWIIDRELWNEEATKIRAQFDAAKHLSPTSGATVRLVREGEEEIAKWAHPDPYTVSYMPGGSSFMRNPPLPLKALYPDGVPAEHNIASKDLHYVQLPMSATPEGPDRALVDVFKKVAE